MKILLGKTFIAALLLSAVTSPVFADSIDKAIKARQGYFQNLSFNLGQLVAMAKGQVDYDAKAAQSAAKNLDLLSQLDLGPAFPAGSDNVAKKGKTRALAKIWADFPGFGAKAGAFREAVVTLQGAAGAGKAEMAAAAGALGKKCSACHDDYRAKDF